MTLGLKFFSGVAKLIIFICTGTWVLSITPTCISNKRCIFSLILYSFSSIATPCRKREKNKKRKKILALFILHFEYCIWQLWQWNISYLALKERYQWVQLLINPPLHFRLSLYTHIHAQDNNGKSIQENFVRGLLPTKVYALLAFHSCNQSLHAILHARNKERLKTKKIRPCSFRKLHYKAADIVIVILKRLNILVFFATKGKNKGSDHFWLR